MSHKQNLENEIQSLREELEDVTKQLEEAKNSTTRNTMNIEENNDLVELEQKLEDANSKPKYKLCLLNIIL